MMAKVLLGIAVIDFFYICIKMPKRKRIERIIELNEKERIRAPL